MPGETRRNTMTVAAVAVSGAIGLMLWAMAHAPAGAQTGMTEKQAQCLLDNLDNVGSDTAASLIAQACAALSP
jgi:Na+/phosphate symporter